MKFTLSPQPAISMCVFSKKEAARSLDSCTASLRALEGTRSVKARPQDKKTQTIQNAAARLPAAPFRTAGGIVSRHFPHTRKQFGLQML